jgi:hypothetical protein
MPTLGAHFAETETEIVRNAAKAAGHVKSDGEPSVGPYIAEAVRQRLEREGYLPGTKEHARREKLEILATSLSDEELDALVAKQCAGKAAAQL